MIERIPLGRIADVEDVVGPTLFFCSAAAAFITSQILCVDGGITPLRERASGEIRACSRPSRLRSSGK
jgi:NAD(P)-dependent dehydrogenase (short-subunit alcohol dehydrogenase family)